MVDLRDRSFESQSNTPRNDLSIIRGLQHSASRAIPIRAPCCYRFVISLSRVRKKDSRLIDVSPYLVRAERVGFEPTVPCGTPVFETGTFGHSVTSPIAGADDRSHAAAAPSVRCDLGAFLLPGGNLCGVSLSRHFADMRTATLGHADTPLSGC